MDQALAQSDPERRTRISEPVRPLINKSVEIKEEFSKQVNGGSRPLGHSHGTGWRGS